VCFAILLIISAGIHSEAQDFPYEDLRNEVARMASQIAPEDRYAVAVMEPVVDRVELQDCIGRPLAETIVQVLWEFQFALIERSFFLEDRTKPGLRLDPSAISKIGEKIGAMSIFTGTVDIDHETIRVAYRMTRVETMEIIGIISCSLSKKEFTDCFLKYDLSPPTLGIYQLLPEPRRIH